MQLHPQHRAPSPADDHGSALTEMALVAPLFILLVFWSQFFADLGVLRLKADEAARYAVWEMTAQRNPSVVANEVKQRFADLASPESLAGTAPVGALSWTSVNVAAVTITDSGDAPFSGRVDTPSGGGGLLGSIMEGINKFLNKAADWIVKQFKFDTRGMAEAQVQFQVKNTLFPSGSILGIFFEAPPEALNITVKAKSPQLLWDTWKAWPGKRWGGSIETSPYDTYPRVTGGTKESAPERVVSNQVAKMSMFGVGDDISKVTSYFEYIKLPDPFGADTWTKKRRGDGPISMLPGVRETASWRPGYNQPQQRVGDTWSTGTTKKYAPDSIEGPQTDRARFTVPSHIQSAFWTGDMGGSNVNASTAPMVAATQNPYVKMYQCRNAYYMGSQRQELKHYNDATWPRRAFQGCN